MSPPRPPQPRSEGRDAIGASTAARENAADSRLGHVKKWATASAAFSRHGHGFLARPGSQAPTLKGEGHHVLPQGLHTTDEALQVGTKNHTGCTHDDRIRTTRHCMYSSSCRSATVLLVSPCLFSESHRGPSLSLHAGPSRDTCSYCTFASHDGPGQSKVYMTKEEVLEVARKGVAAGCTGSWIPPLVPSFVHE